MLALVLSVPIWSFLFTLVLSQQVCCSNKGTAWSRGPKTLSYTELQISVHRPQSPINNLKYVAVHMDVVHHISDGKLNPNAETKSAGHGTLPKHCAELRFVARQQ